jgi:orotate phosphoribosyltransferase
MTPAETHDEDDDILDFLPAREGHFLLESGHHGDRWLELESLCVDVASVRDLARRLARRIARYDIEAVCGPLVEGAFVALMVAEQLAQPFTYAVPRRRPRKGELFPVKYAIPTGLRAKLKDRRVAVVNDVIGAGSAVRGTLEDLRACGAKPVVIGTLAIAGDAARRMAAENDVPLETLARIPLSIWPPSDCPLCAQRTPLQDAEGA